MIRDVYMLRMSMKGGKALAFGDIEWMGEISELGIRLSSSVCVFVFLCLLVIE